MEIKFIKFRQVQASQHMVSKQTSTSKNHKTVSQQDKWMGSKPQWPVMCLQCSYQISHSYNQWSEFHKSNGNMCHTMSTTWPNRGKNSNQIGNAINKSRKNHMWSQQTYVQPCKISAQINIPKHFK